MIAKTKKTKKKARKPKAMKLTKLQLKKIRGGTFNRHELCDASPKGSAADCGSSYITN
jgi:hypothetical protein